MAVLSTWIGPPPERRAGWNRRARRSGRIPSSAAARGLAMPAAHDHGVAPPPQGLRRYALARAGSVGLKNENV
jgi:hypothetical protein